MVLSILDWMLVGLGFSGALAILFFFRSARQRWHTPPELVPHFSPRGGCTEAIVRELNLARREILVQAYSFSCPEIANALIAARKKGVVVHVVLDRSNEKETYSELGPLEEHGIDVQIDSHHAIAHNKVMVIDRKTIVTGSFNFTRQAEHENAENMLIIRGHPDLVTAYIHNFHSHREHSKPPEVVPPAKAVLEDRPRSLEIHRPESNAIEASV